MAQTLFDKFKEKITEMEHILSALYLHDWDTNVNMPPKGAGFRGDTVATLSGLLHEKMLDKEFETILLKLREHMDKKKLTPKQAAMVREVYRTYTKERRLPASFVKEMAQTVSTAHHVWAEARKNNDFKKFAPMLSKIIELKRKQAKFLGYKKSPYDALLDEYEPGLTSEEVSLMFAKLKAFLVPFIKKIGESKKRFKGKLTLGNFPIAKQKKFNELVARSMGFDFEAGRLDPSTHPFTAAFNPHDTRITTRYNQDDVLYALGSTMHEVGHGLYEQGLPHQHFGTPLGTWISLGIHESQSRVWENMVGMGMPFWKHTFPVLQKTFPDPFQKITLPVFYRHINRVRPSLIRVESDEVTYNMHIIIRFEIEKGLIEGVIDVKDLPKIWNAKYKEYLGVDVPSDSLGVLQDVHWSSGLVGYFPTYTLGNLYSAQFYNQAKKEITDMEGSFEKGNFQPFLEWLRKNIHRHGKFYSAADLCEKVTGEGLNINHYINYLRAKFEAIYNG